MPRVERHCDPQVKSLIPNHRNCDKKGENVLYLKLKKALYGIMQAALLFYRRVVQDLTAHGFILNPYDPCVANMVVKVSQLTVIWHVDDMMITHAQPEVVSDLIQWLGQQFQTDLGGKITPVSVMRGKVHDYLGVTFDFTTPGEVKVLMKSYIEALLREFPESKTLARHANTPESTVLFEVRGKTPSLPPEKANLFHRFVAKLLYLAKRALPDVATAVAFLTTRVKSPDGDDWNKLL